MCSIEFRGGGGGGTSICAYWVCVIFEIPIFSPKFPLQSISFSQITEKSAPEHHHFRVFGNFLPLQLETIIFKMSYLQAVSSPPTRFTAASPNGERFGVIQQARMQPAPETHRFHAGSSPRHAEPTSRGTYPPPPPPPPIEFLSADINEAKVIQYRWDGTSLYDSYLSIWHTYSDQCKHRHNFIARNVYTESSDVRINEIIISSYLYTTW